MISMKNELVAIPVFQDRISPLLDVANRFVIFEIVDNEISQKMVVFVHDDCERLRIEKLKELGVPEGTVLLQYEPVERTIQVK